MIKTHSISTQQFEVVYNLQLFEDAFYLPTAYIVSKDVDGLLAHIKQRANNETIGSFDLELDDTRLQLFEIIESLQPKALEKKFNPSKKRQKTIDRLLEVKEIKTQIVKYVHRKLDVLLSAVVRYNLPICWHVERKVLVKDFIMKPEQVALMPILSFKKTDSGVTYQMKLSENDEIWDISSKDVVPITNYPAWVFVDYRLYRIDHINGNMVKPFQKKDIIHIPNDKVKTYFQKFILKVASKLDIDAEGFELIHFNELKGAKIEVIRDVFSNQWGIGLYLHYHNTEFFWNDSKTKRTSLEFGETEVKILQVIRDLDKEQSFLDKLNDLGLIAGDGNYFYLKDTLQEWQLLEWLALNQRKLIEMGFEVIEPTVEQRKIYLEKPSLKMETEQHNDWFDIFGQVKVGEYTFPFLKLSKNIREGNRFYLLPNETYFLIPEEWMNKYRALMKFAQKQSDTLRLKKNQFTLLNEVGIDSETPITENLKDLPFKVSPLLKATLRPYQLEGVKWLTQLYHNNLGGCLADDMGLGKTLQTIAVLLHAKKERAARIEETIDQEMQLDLFHSAGDEDFLKPLNTIIILPASLVFNWEQEIRKFAPSLSTYRHVGPKRHKDKRILIRFDVVLTTYQTALRDVDILEEIEYEYIVLDESQQIKNRESKIFKAINRLQALHKVSLSGTPIENSLSDLWSQMQFINPDLLGSFSFFKREFISAIEKYQDEEKKVRLRKMVAPYVLRRTKEEVAKDLPPLSTKVFYSEMTKEQKRLYEREKSAARNYLLENYEANNPKYRILVLRSLTKLRQIVNHPFLVNDSYEKDSGKFNDIWEQWNVIQRSNHKVLFFSSFVQYLDLFKKKLEANKQPFSILTGEMTQKAREQQIKRFENDPDVKAFLISIKSGGTGLNLVAADYVFILDPWWNPSTEQQAIARAHRIGQTRNVFATKFITKDSIEEKILRLQEKKSRLAEDIIDNVRKTAFTRGDIAYLLE
ncbi:MAG: DEAD/DEAH box helicase [Bacteroidota bacterium]